MDEILLANFMVFHEVVEREHATTSGIGDEAWELDYYLARESRAQTGGSTYGSPTSSGGCRCPTAVDAEAYLTADYNAEMIEHIARYRRTRDRALFVGNAGDIVPERFGPDLPMIREWTEQHFDFTGYISGFDPAQFADRPRLRDELGYQPDEQVCLGDCRR